MLAWVYLNAFNKTYPYLLPENEKKNDVQAWLYQCKESFSIGFILVNFSDKLKLKVRTVDQCLVFEYNCNYLHEDLQTIGGFPFVGGLYKGF